MRIAACLTILLALMGRGQAEPTLTVHSDHSVEHRLKVWLKSDRPHQKIAAAVRRSQSLRRNQEMADLKDAVASGVSSAQLKEYIAKSEGAKQRELVERLPGMARQPFDNCRSLESCADAPSSFYVESDHLIEDAIVGLARPWIHLQKARGKDLRFSSEPGAGDRVVILGLEGLLETKLAIHVTPVNGGGYNVWLRGRPDPVRLYDRERRAALSAAAGS